MATSSRALVSVVLFSVVAWSTLAPPTGADAAESPAVCHFELHNTWDPGGVLIEPTQGTVTSTAGTILCVGVIDGRQVSNEAGTLRWRLLYGGEAPRDVSRPCIYGRAVGSWEVSLPMADGTTMGFTGPVELVWNAAVALKLRGELGRQAVEGIGEARNDPDRDPLVEDNVSCVTTTMRYDIHTGRVVIS